MGAFSPLRSCIQPDGMADTVVPLSPHALRQNAKKITVFGGGSFGTALATCLARNSHDVTILSRNTPVVESINMQHRNCKYLTDYEIPNNVKACSDVVEALRGAEFI